MGYFLNSLVIFFIPLVYVLWKLKSETQKRASDLSHQLLEAKVEIERLNAALKKQKAREEDVAKKLITLAKRQRSLDKK